MNMAETCRLCLGQNPNSAPMTVEDVDFRKKVDRIFFFRVSGVFLEFSYQNGI